MINRYLKTILDNGVEVIQNDLSVLDELFQQQFILGEEAANEIKTYFANKGLNVVTGYPRSDSSFPLVAITLLSDNESEYFLNDDAGYMDTSDDPHFGEDIKTTIWDYVYQLFVYTEHPDITAYYYEIVKSILLISLDQLIDLDVFNFSLGGSELAPDLRYMPEHIFVRQLTFKCSSEFQRFDKESRWLKAFAVRGISVDKNASKRDTGSVITNVTPYSEE